MSQNRPSDVPLVGQAQVGTSDTLAIYDKSTAVGKLVKISDLFTVAVAASGVDVLLAPTAAGSLVTQTIQPTAGSSKSTSLSIKGSGGGDVGTYGALSVFGDPTSGGAQVAVHQLSGNGSGCAFDRNAANGGIGSDGSGDFFVNGIIYGSPQTVNTTAPTAIVADAIVLKGTTTNVTMPSVSQFNGAVVYFKNLGSSTASIYGDAATDMVPLNSNTAQATVTIQASKQATFFSDGSYWHQTS